MSQALFHSHTSLYAPFTHPYISPHSQPLFPSLLPTLSVYVTHYLLFNSSPPPPFCFPTGGWLDGLDVCIALWSRRGDEVTAGRPCYRRQLCQRKSLPTNLAMMTYHPRKLNMYPNAMKNIQKCVFLLFMVVVYCHPTSIITWLVVFFIIDPM